MVDLREYFRESNAIEDVHEETAIDATFEAWEAIKDEDPITHDVIKTGHEYILQDRQPDIAGQYRDIQVYIGESTPPPPVVVESEMEKLLSWEPQNPIEAIEWHIAFEQIHPFADGNGRIGRLLYLRHSQMLEIEPIMWRAEDRAGYYDLFQTDVNLDEKSNI
ncbi:Fic/DOC family protein [Halohasta litchfieldiae]|jgi:Fic family protein|uniref:Fic/DOC family protein n=1 Tax=Halohasta litchfieldiae TaxID=1073996 RepID=A0A1H6V369_9EURY|nr:Fic family protein [Halohasta litchfieldiae]ATW88432.1 Fic/DOC family protein [Halohasta litchfieldiae]SEI94702.1 Fic/DOC family protein [Halohasta litchfieldiae]